MFTVRTVTMTNKEDIITRDRTFNTRRECLHFMRGLFAYSQIDRAWQKATIVRVGRLYVVTPPTR